jgi:adenylosuccinate synthase
VKKITNTRFSHAGHTAVIGAQWGDEGKGKIVDMLAQKHDIVVRYAGGGNAGHTVVVDNEKFVLHLVPCGAVFGKMNIIGNGVVLNFDRLAEEFADLKTRGRELTKENFMISERAHVITPYHLLLDLAQEMVKGKRTGGEIGTTMQGIGPAYQAKMARNGMRFVDLLEDSNVELDTRIGIIAADTLSILGACGITPDDLYKEMNKNERRQKMTRGFQQYFDLNLCADVEKPVGIDNNCVTLEHVILSLRHHRDVFSQFITDASYILSEEDRKSKRILFEGAQGTLLDIDHGTYPHVTSSNTTLGGVYTGTGTCLPLEHKLGILKAYTTRVGNGAFPTELTDVVGKRLQEKGCEYGATTGRPRRCGNLDLVIAKYAVRVNGLNEIALTKLDVLDGEKKIPVCVAYDVGQSSTDIFPTSERALAKAKPVYKILPGWQKDTTKAREFSELPKNAQNFVNFVENYLGTHVKYISIGEKRDQVITRWK